MPTTLRRTTVTHTPKIQRALDAAADRWPGESESRLILRLIEEGEAAIGATDDPIERLRREGKIAKMAVARPYTEVHAKIPRSVGLGAALDEDRNREW